jgi:hypothetical protein
VLSPAGIVTGKVGGATKPVLQLGSIPIIDPEIESIWTGFIPKLNTTKSKFSARFCSTARKPGPNTTTSLAPLGSDTKRSSALISKISPGARILARHSAAYATGPVDDENVVLFSSGSIADGIPARIEDEPA